jgi:hypothetical protein
MTRKRFTKAIEAWRALPARDRMGVMTHLEHTTYPHGGGHAALALLRAAGETKVKVFSTCVRACQGCDGSSECQCACHMMSPRP